MSAFPPHRSTVSLPITKDIALKFLSSYLLSTKTSPYLLPNARLEPSGPTSGAATSSIVIHNLLRVEAGLRGEWMAPSLDLNEKTTKITQGMDDGTSTGAEVEGWMDLDQYQREQSVEGGEIGDRGDHVVAQEGDADLEGARDKGEDDETAVVNEKDGEDEEDAPAPKRVKTKHQPPPPKVVSKDPEARKREKKARQVEEKKAKARAQQAAAAN